MDLTASQNHRERVSAATTPGAVEFGGGFGSYVVACSQAATSMSCKPQTRSSKSSHSQLLTSSRGTTSSKPLVNAARLTRMSWLDVIVSLSSICNDGEDEDDGGIPDVLLIGAVEHRNMHCCAYKSTYSPRLCSSTKTFAPPGRSSFTLFGSARVGAAMVNAGGSSFTQLILGSFQSHILIGSNVRLKSSSTCANNSAFSGLCKSACHNHGTNGKSAVFSLEMSKPTIRPAKRAACGEQSERSVRNAPSNEGGSSLSPPPCMALNDIIESVRKALAFDHEVNTASLGPTRVGCPSNNA
mmetsp:Transcript_4071/g.13418  ORF Transcript_4071/g.13418 Transcript_4071/m.13418 type:complete len:298 (+) Transcript_4071:376-1269(+)